MDKDSALARKERLRQSELLHNSGIGTFGKDSLCRASGEEEASPPKGCSRAETSGYVKERKSSAKAKSRDEHRANRLEQNNSFRRANRKAKAGDRTSRRSATELGIKWIDARCEDSSVSKAHHWVGEVKVNEGSLFECKFCHRVIWLPSDFGGCADLSRNIAIYGHDLGYQKTLDLRPAAKRIMAKIQDIYYLRKAVQDNDIFHLALASIIMDREYPYDVEVIEEEML